MPPSTPSAAGGSVTRRNPPTIWTSSESHSQISIAEAGRLAFCSGQVALPPDGGPVPGDLGEQARLVAANLAANLDELGASPRDIVLLRMYVVDATTERFLAHGGRSRSGSAAICRASPASASRPSGRPSCSSRSRWWCGCRERASQSILCRQTMRVKSCAN